MKMFRRVCQLSFLKKKNPKNKKHFAKNGTCKDIGLTQRVIEHKWWRVEDEKEWNKKGGEEKRRREMGEEGRRRRIGKEMGHIQEL